MIPRSFCALADLLAGRPIAVLSGAGCSTESGIPDYRGPGTRRRARDPILYQAFVRDPESRRRYWARSAVGWARVAAAKPNAAHVALAELETAGIVRGVITQNVDGLHGAAGSRSVVELHGSLARVRCLDCAAGEPRVDLQRRLLALNPGWPNATTEGAAAAQRTAPDGDADLADRAIARFRVAGCRRCGGVLKPDVVFFGENVPRERADAAWRLFELGETLLVVGSSLSVYSGYRFVQRAAREGRPVAIVNLGKTRGDGEARVRVRGRVGEVLPRLADELLGSPCAAARPVPS